MKFGRLIVRVVIGALFVGHGTQKLFGWFDGAGPKNTGQFFEQLGLRPGRRHATAAGAAEALGGAMLTLGLLTPAAAAALIGVMITAIRKVHAKNGMWVTDGGMEYNLVLMAALFAIVDDGPGSASADDTLGLHLSGPAWAAAALAAGALGSYAATELSSSEEPPAEAGEATEREAHPTAMAA